MKKIQLGSWDISVGDYFWAARHRPCHGKGRKFYTICVRIEDLPVIKETSVCEHCKEIVPHSVYSLVRLLSL